MISQFVIRASEGYVHDILLSEVGEGRETAEFQGSEEHCKAVHDILVKNACDIFEYASAHGRLLFEDSCRTGFKPVLLLPGKTNCCAKKICIQYVILTIRFRFAHAAPPTSILLKTHPHACYLD